MTANWFSAPAPVVAASACLFCARESRRRRRLSSSIRRNRRDFPWMLRRPLDRPRMGPGFTRKPDEQIESPCSRGFQLLHWSRCGRHSKRQVSCEFLSWTKLTMALATGSQHMNLLAPVSGAEWPPMVRKLRRPSWCKADRPRLRSPWRRRRCEIRARCAVALDADYAGQTGYVGSPVAGAYVRQPLSDVDYIRRVTFNVGLSRRSVGRTLTLAHPLPGGAPRRSAKLQALTGFVDREGGSFYQEWSALFVMQGSQGERIFFHYPRLQSAWRRRGSHEPTRTSIARAASKILWSAPCCGGNLLRCR